MKRLLLTAFVVVAALFLPSVVSAFQIGVSAGGGGGFASPPAGPSRAGLSAGFELGLRIEDAVLDAFRVSAGYDAAFPGIDVTDRARVVNVPYLAVGLDLELAERIYLSSTAGGGPLLAASGPALHDPAGFVARFTVGVDRFTENFNMALGYEGVVSYGVQLWGITGSGHAVALLLTATWYVVD